MIEIPHGLRAGRVTTAARGKYRYWRDSPGTADMAAAKEAPPGRKGFRVSAKPRDGKLTEGAPGMGWVRSPRPELEKNMGKVLRIVEANARLADFDLFWECYPKKKAKLDAQKAWKQTENVRPHIEQILAALDTQSQSVDWTRDGGQFIPYPATWLRQGRWDDE